MNPRHDMEDSISSADNRKINDGIEVRQLEKDRYYIEKLRRQREKVSRNITQMELMQQQYRRLDNSMKEQDNYIVKLEGQLLGCSKKEQLEAMRQEVISCQNQLKKLREQHIRVKEEAVAMHQRLISQESLNLELNQKLTARQEAINLLKCRLTKQEQKMCSVSSSHDHEIETIRQKWLPFKSEMDTLRKNNQQLQLKLKSIFQQNQQLKNISQDQQAQIQTLRSENEIFNRKMKEQPVQYRPHQDPSRQLISVLEHQLSRADRKCEKMEQENSQLRKLNREKERRLSQMAVALKQQMAVISGLQDNVKDLENTVNSCKGASKTQLETIQRLKFELECVKQPSEASTQQPDLQLLKMELSRMRNHEIDLMDQVFEEFRIGRHF